MAWHQSQFCRQRRIILIQLILASHPLSIIQLILASHPLLTILGNHLLSSIQTSKRLTQAILVIQSNSCCIFSHLAGKEEFLLSAVKKPKTAGFFAVCLLCYL